MTNQTKDQKDIDTSWVEGLSNQKKEEKHVMLEISNVDEDKRKNTSRLRKLLYFLLLSCVVAVIVLAVKLSKASRNEADTSSELTSFRHTEQQSRGTEKASKNCTVQIDDVCTTKECILASAQIFESMDSTLDPCKSFYDYACGGWIKSHTIPADRGNLATYALLRDQVNSRIHGILGEETSVEELKVFRDVKHLYQACENEDLIEQRNLSVIYPLLHDFGGWPILGDSPGGDWNESRFDIVNLLVSIMKFSNYPLISSWVGMDDKNNSRNIIFIDQPGLGMPGRKYYLNPSLMKKYLAYKTLVRNIALMLGASKTTIDEDVENLLKFEIDIANITVRREDRRDSNSLYNKMTIRELQNNYTMMKDCMKIQNLDGLQRKIISIDDRPFDWLQYIQGAIDTTGLDVNMTEDEDVVLVSIPYYTKLWNILNQYSPRTITNYAIWTIIKNNIWSLPSRFRDEYHMYKKNLYGTPTQNERWKTCSWYARNVAKMVVGRLYVERYVDDKAKTEMQVMIKNIRNAFQKRVKELDWMDDTVKEFSNEKVNYMIEAVAYPDSIKNNTFLEEFHSMPIMDPTKHFENVLKVLQKKGENNYVNLRVTNDIKKKRIKWTTSPTTVNAFYSFQRNQITFPAGIMSPPYFHERRPKAMNYGALGFLVGHEISHGFDDRDVDKPSEYEDGRQYDKIGNLFNWWTKEAEQKFDKKKECLLQQYGNYFWEEAGMKINAVNTIGENIADNGGIKQAYKGYKIWLKQNGGSDMRLPGVEYTHDQLFFIGFAQSRCGTSRHDNAVNHILTGVHSPLKFRVDGSLQNMEEFADAFNCPLNSTMNPEKRCAVW